MFERVYIRGGLYTELYSILGLSSVKISAKSVQHTCLPTSGEQEEADG